MFTGIIEETGRIERIVAGAQSLRTTISGHKILSDIEIGCSIAVNGVCLTATTFDAHSFTADVMPESVRMTTLADLKPGSPVNLERAMAVGGRFGGHVVAGHVDGIGTIRTIEKQDNAVVFTIAAAPEVMEYIVYKGSVAIDGASLTVAGRSDTQFTISIIPHTIKETILAYAKPGTKVNIETDIFGRYIRQFMTLPPADNTAVSATGKQSGGITSELLAKNGFI